MNKIHIAYDIDGTLRKNSEEKHRTLVEPNERIVNLLIANAHSKNVETHLWSNRGAEYCRAMRLEFGLQKYVKETNCHLKQWRKMQEVEIRVSNHNTVPMLRADAFRPDIAYDDQQNFDGGKVNIIVREK